MLKYYYIDDISKLQCGPFTPNELARKGIRPDTMVWRSGMVDWVEAGTMPELNYLFDSKIPVPQEVKQPEQKPPQPTTVYSQQPQQQNRPNPQNKPDSQVNLNGILPMPKQWLVESILLTIFCCSPISLVGIFYAGRVETLYRNNDYEGAMDASKKAKQWTLAGLLFLPAVFVFFTFIGIFF